MPLPPLADALVRVAMASTILLALAHAAAFLLRKHSAAFRHLTWSAALLAVVMLPMATLIPGRLPWLPPATNQHPEFRRRAPKDLVSPSADVLSLRLSTSNELAVNPDAAASATVRHSVEATSSPEPLREAPLVTQAPRGELSPAPTPAPIPWPSIGAFIWTLGTAFFSIKVVSAVRAAGRAIRSAHSASESQSRRFRGLADRLGAPNSTKLLVCSELHGPRTAGVVAPVVLAPRDDDWHASIEGEISLLHELSHAKRHDVTTQFLGLLATALYWWNPLVWSAA